MIFLFALYLKITLNFLIFDIVPAIKWYYFQYKNEYTRRGKMNQRVEAVDAIRGFALFGILLVNMTLIQFGFFTSEKPTYLFGDLDKGANWFIQFFGTHNFISLFSFLFGLSIILLQKSNYRKRKKLLPHIHKTYYHSFTTRLHSRHFCLGGRYFICIRNNRDFLNDVHQSKTENFAHLGDYSTRTYYTYVLSN